MRIKLLNDGGYRDMDAVEFPVEVEATNRFGSGYEVSGAEILRIGGAVDGWFRGNTYYWANSEVERCD